MSELVLSAQFVRMGRNPFGPKPKDVPVFAQLLVGGAGVWIFTSAGRHGMPASTLQLFADEAAELDVLRTGFAVLDPDVPAGPAAATVERLRTRAGQGGLTVTDEEAAEVSAAISDLDVHLHLTMFTGDDGWVHPDPGGWRVTASAVPRS